MTARERLGVALGSRSYDIILGAGLLEEAGVLMRPLVKSARAIVVTDRTVAALHLPRLAAGLAAADMTHEVLVLPPGEETKSFAHFAALTEDILALGIERATPIIALGGGVIGDLAGFAAATLLRGLDYVQVPTTLLAQVDSSVGGKTAIDTRAGKNLVGAFHQPVLVLADGDALATLPRRELLAGYAEVVKYGLIRDLAFFQWLEAQGPALIAGDQAARLEAVRRSCLAKAAVVAADERENGERALLNFGHTFGHALEAASGFGAALLHGEAVALGMMMAFDFAVELGFCPAAEARRVERHFVATGLPHRLARLANAGPFDADQLLSPMAKDKKVKDGRITLILPRTIGEVFITRDVPPARLREFLAAATTATTAG